MLLDNTLYSMNHMAKLYCVGSVSVRVHDCISLVLILWLFSHSTKFVPKLCQLPCYFSHCRCFVCIFLLDNISWARDQAKNTVILAGQANFYSTVLCWISSKKWLLWQHQKFCCFQSLFSPLWEKLTFLVNFPTSVLQLYCCVWVDCYHIFVVFPSSFYFWAPKTTPFLFRKHLLF